MKHIEISLMENEMKAKEYVRTKLQKLEGAQLIDVYAKESFTGVICMKFSCNSDMKISQHHSWFAVWLQQASERAR